MKRSWLMFAAGLLAGAAICLGSQWYGRWYSGRQMYQHPDTPAKLALLWRWAMVAEPETALAYWSDGRRPHVTATELDRLAEIMRSAPNAGIESYIALRPGRRGDPGAQVVLLRAIEPGLIGNRYWEIEDALVFPAAEFDAHALRDVIGGGPGK